MATDTEVTLSEQILRAPEPVWLRIKAALRVETRPEAATLVDQDPDAAQLVQSLLGGNNNQTSQGSVLTKGKGGRSALTALPSQIPTTKKSPRMEF